MKTILRHMLLFASILITPMAFALEGDAQIRQLLKDMSEAMRSQNYQGRFMYLVDGKMSSFEIQHAVIDGQEHERLVFLNQKEQEIVRVGHDVYCTHTGNYLFRESEDVTTNPFSEKIEKLNEKTLGFYQLSIEEGKIIAGRTANQVNFVSRDGHRYNRHLWIDQQSKLLLKMDITNDMAEVLESFEFSQIEVGLTIPKSEFSHKGFASHQAKHFEMNPQSDETSHEQKQTLQNSQWQSSWLPQGFYFSGKSHEAGQSKKNNENGAKVLEMLMYSDGLSAITVFIEKVDHKSVFNESSQQGAVSVYSEVHVIDEQGFMVTSIGEVPLTTLERITKGVVFQN